MEVNVVLKDWKVVEKEGTMKIAGSFSLNAGPTELATQQFNDGYQASTVLFPTALIIEAEAFTAKIAAAITANFTGKKETVSDGARP